MQLTPEDHKKQELYRDARFTKQYDDIWQSVGKCVFCDLKEKYVFFEENGVVMTISLFAYIDGHFMILPRRHVRSLKNLSQIEWETVRKFSYIAKKLINDVHGVKGMQLIQKDGVTAQSTVSDHVHFHCVPFDSPDLLDWNYRKLKHTPLENVSLYKQARKKLITYDRKFETKYTHKTELPIVCDLIIINEKREVLMQQRSPETKFVPDTLSLPGGHAENFDVPLEQELAREVEEETGLKIDLKKVRLINSEITKLKLGRRSTPLKAQYTSDFIFIWNAYLLKGFDSATPLTPGDDAEAHIWIPLGKVQGHKQITEGIQRVIKGLNL